MTFSLTNPLTADNLIALLYTIINGLIRLSIPIAVILIIWAAVLYMTATGKPEQLKTATRALIWVILGFGILLIASGIVAIIQDFLGVSGPMVSGQAPMGPSTLEALLEVLRDISGWLFSFAIIAGIAIIITAGLVYMFSGGSPERASRALRILLYAIIGVAIAVLAWSIINIVANFLTGKPIFATLFTDALAAPISAERPANAPTGGPTSLGQVFNIIQDIVGWLFVVGIIVGLGVIILAGIVYFFSGGNPDRARTATNMLLYAIIGVAIVALAWAIVNTVGNFFVAKRIVD